MPPMINGYPTEDELHNRITNQLTWRNSSDAVALIWRGYLAGLLEWGLIEVGVYDSLSKLLPEIGNKELYELFSDESISREKEQEIEEYLRSKKIEK